MATPMTADQMVATLRAAGLNVREYKSWRTHSRNHKGAWGPVHGIMMHHTVTTGTARSVELCYAGHSTLPGPLCHGVIDKAGTVWLVGNGRANHAGLGDDDVLSAVVAESALPAAGEANTDGNRSFYGFECVNLGDGKDPWPAAQVDAMVRVAAAISEHHGWTERSTIAHKEWQPGKIDPRGPGFPSMTEFRARAAKVLGAGAANPPVTPTKPSAPAPKPKPAVDLSNVLAAARRDPGLRQGGTTHPADVKRVEAALVAEGLLPAKYGKDGSFGSLTRSAYAAWQRRCGYSGRGADGLPGLASLRKLGAKHGFSVKA